MWLLALTIIATITTLIALFRRKTSSKLPPGPWNLPIFGSLLWLNPSSPHLSLLKFLRKYGKVFAVRLGTVYTVVIADEKVLRKVLAKSEALAKPPLLIFDVVFKNFGIINSSGEVWAEARKFIVGYLSTVASVKIYSRRKILERNVIEKVARFVEYINEQEKNPIDCKREVAYYVSSISTTLIYGKSWPQDHQDWKTLVKGFHEILHHGTFAAPINFLPFLKFLPRFKRTLHAIKEIRTTIDNVNTKIVEEFIRDSNTPNLITEYLKTVPEDEKSAHDKQLLSLLFDVSLATTESVISSLYWILLYLAAYTDIQENVRKELRRKTTLEIEDLANMPYTEATLAEVMRIRSAAPLGVARCALDDIDLGEMLIPKGAMIMPFLWGIHMNPDVWEEPDEFRPERFLDEEGKYRKREAFLPFQCGKRICPGEDMVTRGIIFLFIASILQRFKFVLHDKSTLDLKGDCGFSLSPKPHKFVFSKI